jgi:ubiquinone/menaquinone biosynthesis C-methylase UbiE
MYEMLTNNLNRRIGSEVEPRPNVLQRILAAMYDRFNAAVEETALSAPRRTLLSNAHGSVLDVGAGTGANLAHYPSAVDRVALIDLDPGMLARAAARLPIPGVSVEVRLGSAETSGSTT